MYRWRKRERPGWQNFYLSRYYLENKRYIPLIRESFDLCPVYPGCVLTGAWQGLRLGVRVVQSEVTTIWSLPLLLLLELLDLLWGVSQGRSLSNGILCFFLFLVPLWSWESTSTSTALGSGDGDCSHSTLTLPQASGNAPSWFPWKHSILLLLADEMCHVKLCTKLKQEGNNPSPI